MAAVWLMTTRATTAAMGGEAAQRGPGQAGQPEVGRVVGDLAQGRDAVRVQMHDGDQDRGRHERHERRREPLLDPRPTGNHGQHGQADRKGRQADLAQVAGGLDDAVRGRTTG